MNKPTLSKETSKRLGRPQQKALRRGYKAKRPVHGATSAYNLGAEIKACGESLEGGLLRRGFYPYSAR